MPLSTRVVSFDAGGVLLFPNWDRVSGALATCGLDVTSDALARADAIAKRAMDQPAHVAGAGNVAHGKVYFRELLMAAGVTDDSDCTRGLAAVTQEHRRQSLWDAVSPDARVVLCWLKERGYRLLVISNSDGRLHGLLHRTGLDGFFERVVDSGDAGVEKPDPRIFLTALAGMDVPPHAATHVGDVFEVDVVGARAAGLIPVLLDPYGLHTDRACERIASLAELCG